MRPTMRPGICRTCSSRQQRNPKYGPPEDRGIPSGCPSPQAMSAPLAPHSPGGARTLAASGFTNATASAPWACAQSVSASTPSITPKKFGCGTTSAAMSSPLCPSSAANEACPPFAQ